MVDSAVQVCTLVWWQKSWRPGVFSGQCSFVELCGPGAPDTHTPVPRSVVFPEHYQPGAGRPHTTTTSSATPSRGTFSSPCHVDSGELPVAMRARQGPSWSAEMQTYRRARVGREGLSGAAVVCASGLSFTTHSRPLELLLCQPC